MNKKGLAQHISEEHSCTLKEANKIIDILTGLASLDLGIRPYGQFFVEESHVLGPSAYFLSPDRVFV